ncbi:MAG: hypothetical protein AAF962_21740 [Actinomycetota bacterium]
MRPVRLADGALDDVEFQLSADAVGPFLRHDLAPALDLLGAEGVWEYQAVENGPGRRLTIEGTTVAGFHLFALADDLDPREGALVVFAVDIWSREFPE